MSFKLPPLNSLRAFEAAAAAGSFTRAGADLGISQGAISRHISLLEETVGVRLFHRHHRLVELTKAGVDYAKSVRAALQHIESATARVKDFDSSVPVHFRVFPTFAARWLLPRLPDFREKYPHIALQFTTGFETPLIETEPVDLIIHHKLPTQTDLRYDSLFDVKLLPVCSSKMGRQIQGIRHPEELLRFTLLHSINRTSDWALWFKSCGVNGKHTPGMLTFGNSDLTYSAAINGLGIALAQPEFVRTELQSGKLVCPWPKEVATGASFNLACRAPVLLPENVRIFRKWLLKRTADASVEERTTAAGAHHRAGDNDRGKSDRLKRAKRTHSKRV